MTSRRSAPIRRRPYVALVRAHDSNTSNTRNTLVTPSSGRRIRVLRVRVIQEQTDGRRLWELYLGTGADITTDPAKAIDILDIPNDGEAAEVLSGRWLGTPPTTVHKIIVEYTEES